MEILNTTVAAFLGSLLATGIIAYFTQKRIERRERRNKRDELKLEYRGTKRLQRGALTEISRGSKRRRRPPDQIAL